MTCDAHDDDHTDTGLAKLPVPENVQEAIRTLIRWAGDDPSREGLLDTPARVARAWREYCQGNEEEPAGHLARQFEEVGGYNELVLLKDIPFQSHCEHHMAPITGKASIAYMRQGRGHFQACARTACLCPPPANSGTPHRRGRPVHLG